mgnify:CR=1 FL=1
MNFQCKTQIQHIPSYENILNSGQSQKEILEFHRMAKNTMGKEGKYVNLTDPKTKTSVY